MVPGPGCVPECEAFQQPQKDVRWNSSSLHPLKVNSCSERSPLLSFPKLIQKIRKPGLRLPNLIISVVFQDAMLCLLLIKCLFIGGKKAIMD